MSFYPWGEYKSSEELKDHFKRYCSWCWGGGFGDCDKCTKRKNKALLKLKLKEFNEGAVKDEPNKSVH